MYLNSLPSILVDNNITAKNQWEEERSKRQISVKLENHQNGKMVLLYDFELSDKSSYLQVKNLRRECVPTVCGSIQSTYGMF